MTPDIIRSLSEYAAGNDEPLLMFMRTLYPEPDDGRGIKLGNLAPGEIMTFSVSLSIMCKCGHGHETHLYFEEMVLKGYIWDETLRFAGCHVKIGPQYSGKVDAYFICDCKEFEMSEAEEI